MRTNWLSYTRLKSTFIFWYWMMDVVMSVWKMSLTLTRSWNLSLNLLPNPADTEPSGSDNVVPYNAAVRYQPFISMRQPCGSVKVLYELNVNVVMRLSTSPTDESPLY